MIEHPKSFRRIYMASSAVFSAATCAYAWTAPFGAAFGLAVNLTEDSKKSNIEEFDNAVESALRRTRKSMSSEIKHKILDELSEMEVEPDSLSELIEKTEAFQIHYCTRTDVKEIINVFDMFFRDEISKRPNLSNLYVLSTGFVTLEKLKLMNDILIRDEEKLDNIQNKVTGIMEILTEIYNGFIVCVNRISFILIAMAVFLGINIFSEYTYDRMMIGIAPVCYGISEFLVFLLNKKRYIIPLDYSEKLHIMFKLDKICSKIITVYVIPIFITVACFLIIFFTIGVEKEVLLFSTLNLICGNIVSVGIKDFQSKKINVTNKIELP